MTTSSTNNSVYRGFFEKQKLTGPNFINWYRQLRIVLSIEDKLNYLEQPIPPVLVAPAGQQVALKILAAHTSRTGASSVRDFHSCRQEEGLSMSLYVLKMKGYIDNPERLGHPVTLGLGVSLILIGLRKEYDGFVQNYYMHIMGKKINELHVMLKLHKQTLPKRNAPALNAIRAGLRASRKLKPEALSLYVGNGQREAVEAIGTFYLCLPSGLEIVLNNCHYAPSITRGVIFVSCLDGIFEIDLSNSLTNESSVYAVNNKRAKLDLDSALLWHCRLGHVSKKRIKKLQHDGLLYSSDLTTFQKCVLSLGGKMARKPYTHQVERAKDLLGLIHTDVCGPFKIMSRQGASCFATFTDDFSRYGYVYLLKHKHKVFETFKVFQKEVENQLEKTIKSLCSDHGGEYMSQEFLDHLKDHGIIAHRTPPYTPRHNGVSERRNKTLLDMVQSMMSQTTLLKCFWDYAHETAACILNMVPTKKVEKTPYENSLIDQEASGSLEDLKIIQEEDTHPSLDTSLNHEEEDLEIDEPQSDSVPIQNPLTIKLESEKWLNAMNVEMQSIKGNEVWVLVKLPSNGKTVGSKWLFKKKTNMNGNIHIYKARLVAKGFTQTPGIDYEETFSLVADIRAIRILITIAAYYDYEIWQIDVKTAFLNGYLDEEVYVEQPKGFVNPNYPNRVCKLKRSIYRLKQASRQFYGGDLKRELRVSCYTDTEYLTDADDLKSGYVFVLNGGVVDWKSAKQSIFATSSAEAEYIAAFDASKEAVWVRKFISGLIVVPTIE
nr:retrotransposon protein, putative, Ty1-copia subclass [Tanacetum cinerariifolium]